AVASWSISYYPRSICVLERSSVDFSCTFDYPYYYTLKTTKWFKPEVHQKQDGSQMGISVYQSNTAEIHQLYKNRTAYANQDRNCSLQIHNVSKSDNGMYFFRFEMNSNYGKYTGSGGIHLSVAAKFTQIYPHFLFVSIVTIHQNFLLTATAVFLFLMAVVMFGLIIRRIPFTSKKQPTEQTPAATVTEEIYENLRKSAESEENYRTYVIYADLSLPPSTSDR
ncbi:uncharacterized protein, partial [Sinocyclocheilus grahami]|uniref:uncharacterized protein n=1 Tax=Sinocyclocheilus grahami TaxID=75366 RepID=UPI0007AD3D79